VQVQRSVASNEASPRHSDRESNHSRIESTQQNLANPGNGAPIRARRAVGKRGGQLDAAMSAPFLGLRGGGRPLSAGERAFFEPRFGADFSRVRLHTDSRAEQAERAVHARAFTLGNDVAFRSGQYNPNAEAGRHLLGHVLTHVLQQGQGLRREPSLVQRQHDEALTVRRRRDIYRCLLLPDLCFPPPPPQRKILMLPPIRF